MPNNNEYITILVIPVSRPAASYYPIIVWHVISSKSDVCVLIDLLGNTSIVKHTILEAPVFSIQQYW
jgi:hypothetical protein